MNKEKLVWVTKEVKTRVKGKKEKKQKNLPRKNGKKRLKRNNRRAADK